MVIHPAGHVWTVLWHLQADLTSHAHHGLTLHGPTVAVSDSTSKLLMNQLHEVIPGQLGCRFCQMIWESADMVLPDGKLDEFAVLLDQLSQLLLVSQLVCILLQMKGHPCAALQRLSTVVLFHLQRPGSSYQRSHAT